MNVEIYTTAVALSNQTTNLYQNTWQELLQVNRNLAQLGDTSGVFSKLTVGMNVTSSTFYLVGVSVGKGEIGPYNPLGVPLAANGLAIGNAAAALATSLAPTITAGTGAPSATQPNGSLYTREDGTTGSRLYVSTGSAWNAVAGV